MRPHLPTELWLEILNEASQGDLAALSNTCKHLHQLTESILYSKFSWIPEINRSFSWMPDSNVYEYTTRPDLLKSKFPRVHLLLRTLLNRPELARHIKSARFISPFSSDGYAQNILPFWIEHAESGFTTKDLALAEVIIKEGKFVAQNQWLDGLQNGRSDIILALLLSQLSEITSLDIRLRTVYYQPPIVGSKILEVLSSRTSSHQGPTFKNLKSVTLSIDRDENGYQNCEDKMTYLYRFDRQVAPLFSIPSVEKLELSWLNPEPPMGPKTVPIAANLNILILKDNRINENFLGTVLEGTPCLEILECELTYDRAAEKCNCQKLNAALSQVATTLQVLMIGICTNWSHAWGAIDGTMGPMTHFQKLTHLAMPLIALVDSPWTRLTEIAPSQLEIFEVGWHDSRQSIVDVEAQLDQYLDEAPTLQSMKVNAAQNWSRSFRTKLSQLTGHTDGDIGPSYQLEPVVI